MKSEPNSTPSVVLPIPQTAQFGICNNHYSSEEGGGVVEVIRERIFRFILPLIFDDDRLVCAKGSIPSLLLSTIRWLRAGVSTQGLGAIEGSSVRIFDEVSSTSSPRMQFGGILNLFQFRFHSGRSLAPSLLLAFHRQGRWSIPYCRGSRTTFTPVRSPLFIGTS